MIPESDKTPDSVDKVGRAVCDSLSENDGGLKRDIFAHAGNRWSLAIIHALGNQGRLRHSVLSKEIGNVTQRMLTHTLRNLERDGLVTRHVLSGKPLQVEYALTPLGAGLLSHLIPLWTWLMAKTPELQDARRVYDATWQPGAERGL